MRGALQSESLESFWQLPQPLAVRGGVGAAAGCRVVAADGVCPGTCTEAAAVNWAERLPPPTRSLAFLWRRALWTRGICYLAAWHRPLHALFRRHSDPGGRGPGPGFFGDCELG